ncbi:MAG: molybdopterin-dependent oxidoreductase [Coriobacteriales bacterium]
MTVHPSSCQGCAACCSVLVEVEDGQPVRVSGNPANPATGGAVCPALQITLQQQVDPDRVRTPLRRTNPRKGRGEDPGFVPVSWDDALDEIAERMLALRAAGKGERLVVTRGRCTGISNLLFKALPEIFGTPNAITHDGICAEAEKLATGCMDGIWDYRDYRFDQAECVVLWGTDPVVSNRFKPVAGPVFAQLGASVRVYAVSPHRSLSAERAGAESWVPVIPGTDSALALAMAHVILAESLWNRTYVGDFCDGANRFAPGQLVDEELFCERGTSGLVRWWNLELRHRTPQWAQERCGVSAERIAEMARALAAAGECGVSWVSPGVTMTPRGLASGMACFALNALVGSLDAEGGVMRFESMPTAPWPSTLPFQDEQARRALACPPADQRQQRGCMAARGGRIHANHLTNRLADAMLSGQPYPVEMMIGYWNNFAFSCSGARRWEQALSALPFFVHVTTNLSESSQFADIVLPAKSHLFETWGYTLSRMRGRSCLSVQAPCAPARGQVKGDEGELPFMLAQKLAEKGFPQLLEYYRACFPGEDGRPPADGEDLARNAVRIITRPSWEREGSWEDFLARGVTRSPASPAGPVPQSGASSVQKPGPVPNGNAGPVPNADTAPRPGAGVPVRAAGETPLPFPTPSGRFELCSGVVERMLAEYAQLHDISPQEAVEELGYSCTPELLALPHWEEPLRAGSADEYPLIFSQHRAFGSLEGRSANTPLFQKMKRLDPGDEPWADVLKVHPADLERLGIPDGAEALLESPVGSGVVRVKAWDGVLPGVVSKCYGQGHWAYGHVAALDFDRQLPRGLNANELIPAVYEGISGATARHGGVMRVRLRPLKVERFEF